MKDFITVVGLDVHKESIEVVMAEAFGKQEVRHYGKIGGDMTSLDKAVRKLVSNGGRLQFVYEAGPCGYEIYRRLTKQGYECAVVAPSMIPKRSGNRIKNDRRDAEALARLYRAGELTTVHVPREEDEAMRDLVRGRQDAVKGLRTAKQQLGAFLLRHGLRYSRKTSWGIAYMRWLADVKMPHAAQQITLQEYIHARRVLVEAAHAYRYPARVSRPLLKRQEGLAQPICDIAWKAQVRLCGRYRRLAGRGKAINTVITAIARELAGFMWAIAQQVQKFNA